MFVFFSSSMRTIVLGLTLFFELAPFALPPSLSAQESSDLKVEYTGKLFGYYRIEPNETVRGTQAGASGIKLSAVSAFLGSLPESNQQPDTLLLGMGDNFAPEFGASIEPEFRFPAGTVNPPRWTPCSLPVDPPKSTEPTQWHHSAPEALYKSERRKPELADCDNVTRFLITAGYRAVVPGREDFIYSATWLRRIAYLLRGASLNTQPSRIDGSNGKWTFDEALGPDRPLHMLAANIRVKISRNSCPLLFSDDLAEVNHPCLPSNGSMTEEMDWFQRLDRTLDTNGVEDSLNRQAKSDVEFRTQTVINQITVLSTLLAGYGCDDVPRDLAAFSKTETYVVDEERRSLTLTSSARDLLQKVRSTVSSIACKPIGELSGAEAATTLQRIAIGALDAVHDATTGKIPEAPILVQSELRQQALNLFLNLIYAEQKDIGFTITKLPSGKNVLVIAVVGQEALQEISEANRKVYPDDQDCATSNKDRLRLVCDTQAIVKPLIEMNSSLEKVKSFELAVGDPHLTLTAVLRAAWAAREHAANSKPAHVLFDSVIVMAQMPSAEAEELAERVRADIQTSYSRDPSLKAARAPSIDLILSEAQYGHETPNLEIRTEPGRFTPVLVPPEAYSRWVNASGNSVSVANLSTRSDPGNPSLTRLLSNAIPPVQPTETISPVPDDASDHETASYLLKQELDRSWKTWITQHPNHKGDTDLDVLWDSCEAKGKDGKEHEDRSCQNTVLMRYLLHQLQRSSRSDIVLLERRDFYFDLLGDPSRSDQYADYSVCSQWEQEEMDTGLQGQTMRIQDANFYLDYCKLKIALDRVLWKGDYAEGVMVDGATITALMKTAQEQTDQEQSLVARDVRSEWLMTKGIVTERPKNLVTASSGPDTFSVPGSDGCGNSSDAPDSGKSNSSIFCIDGQSILSDRAYWLTTSDQLAQDNTVYSALGTLTAKSNHYTSSSRIFLTTEIADELTRRGQPPELLALTKPGSPTGKSERNAPSEINLAAIENLHQDRNLIQLDFSKLVAGYTLTSPSLSDAALANNLSGVSNTQAVTPHSQELDLEGATRLTFAPVFDRFALGAQSDAEYDRRVLGNLTGNPETVTYSANSFSAGGFAQMAIHSSLIPGLGRNGINQSTRNLPSAFLVFAPYQYQRQMTGTFINFAFFTPPNTNNPQQQVTVHIPTGNGFSQRGGFRYQFTGIWRWTPGPGSYFEIGPEYAEQNNVLSAIRMPQLSPTAACDVIATQSIQTCVKNAYKAAGASLNASSILIPTTQTLHVGGLYWTVHLQKVLNKQKTYNTSFDTQGDSFLLPGTTLTTQTRYAFSTKLALNFKIAGNLSLSPIWSDFFFENQGLSSQRTNVVATTFSISAKWYFARDAQVPFHKQLWFDGPASLDQTSSAKVK